MTTSSLTRRAVLAALPAGAALCQLGPIRGALAQDEGAFKEQLQKSKDIAMNLADWVREIGGRVESDRAATIQDLDYRGRHDLANVASGMSQRQLHGHVREGFEEAADTMVDWEVSLIPAPGDIVRIATLRTPEGDRCPPVGEVMWDILFDALGLLEEREFFMAALHAVSGTTERVERIEDSLNQGRWDDAVDGFFDLLEFLLEGGTVIVLARTLDERLAKPFLRAVSIRLVPFVGTGYAIGAFGLAVHRHWNRLFCAR